MFVEVDCAWLSSVRIWCSVVLLCALRTVVTCPGNFQVNDSLLCEICRCYGDEYPLGCDTGCSVIL